MLAALAITTVSRGYLVGHLNQVMQFASRASERVIKYDKVIVRKDAKFVPKVWYTDGLQCDFFAHDCMQRATVAQDDTADSPDLLLEGQSWASWRHRLQIQPSGLRK
jgi:hypothetical protein